MIAYSSRGASRMLTEEANTHKELDAVGRGTLDVASPTLALSKVGNSVVQR